MKPSRGSLGFISEQVEETIQHEKPVTVTIEFAKLALAIYWIRQRQPQYFLPRVRYYTRIVRAVVRGEWEQAR